MLKSAPAELTRLSALQCLHLDTVLRGGLQIQPAVIARFSHLKDLGLGSLPESSVRA